MSEADQLVLTNAKLFTATSEEAIDNGAVWIEGEFIRFAGPAGDLPAAAASAPTKDLGGRFVMPGMTESHAHLSFTDSSPYELGNPTAEESMIAAIRNSRMMLGCGFTSAISFGSVHKIDIHLKEAIEAGTIPGPRLRPGGKDIGTTSSNVDSRGGLSMIGDGPWELRKIVRDQRYDNVEIVKIFLDGEGMRKNAPPGELSFSDEEVAAVVDEAHRHGQRVACHSRSDIAVQQAIRHDIDLIGHGNYVTDETVEMIKKKRDKVTVGPAIAWEVTFCENLAMFGQTPDSPTGRHYQNEVDATVVAMKKYQAAGIRTPIGGDYGISIAPHGAYAKDIQYYVDLFGFTPGYALLCATEHGGSAADPDGMIGTLEAGKYADLVVVNGDPLADVSVLQDHSKIDVVMKGGKLYRGLTNRHPFDTTADDVFEAASEAAAARKEILEPAE
ncbi:MAG: amidohydrolase family protein [Proteobacteria bacterium]|nr:amidohydrolase family protein [Pseudomonadota bacterium]